MDEDQQADIPVELTYRLTEEDFREALVARSKASATGRRTRLLLIAVFALAAVATALSLANEGTVDPPLVVMLLVAPLLLLGLPRLQARQFHRLAADKGEFRATVTESGITVQSEHSSSTHSWQAAPRYVETTGLFVLLSSDKNASCLTMLPKRGLAGPAEVDRLRGALDRSRTGAGAAVQPAGR
ncbi:YcxB family protein [Kitasatospora sp. NPDC057015]|uniref:YcxB family protein n=1 Tax=Kitasatospora sp. NPDC057015 TaxID=3346001 RepID=UPI003642CB95